jgi:hypothetical protein
MVLARSRSSYETMVFAINDSMARKGRPGLTTPVSRLCEVTGYLPFVVYATHYVLLVAGGLHFSCP